jgi:uncharacterized protein (TIGR00730 family)
MNNKNICVYCSSSEAVDDKYFEITKRLAELIVKKSYNLVYGGANVGLMRCLAENVKKNNGKVIGVIPESIHNKGIGFENADEFYITEDMHKRKAKMAELSDSFIALPGGFGTVEELCEIITLKHLNYHQKAIVIINYDNFYLNLLKQFDEFYKHKFSKEICKQLYFVAENEITAINYIENYIPIVVDQKWFDVRKNAF